jgi:hypothetical protein
VTDIEIYIGEQFEKEMLIEIGMGLMAEGGDT